MKKPNRPPDFINKLPTFSISRELWFDEMITVTDESSNKLVFEDNILKWIDSDGKKCTFNRTYTEMYTNAYKKLLVKKAIKEKLY